MFSFSDNLGEVELAFSAFKNRYGVAPPAEIAEELARKIAMLGLFPSKSPLRLETSFSKRPFKPKTSEAVEMGQTFRVMLGVEDEEPLFDFPALLFEKFGVPVFQISKLSHVSGGCANLLGTTCIFVSKEKQIDALFNCAHQLGHLILLNLYGKNEVSLDVCSAGLGTPKPPYEHFADVFALELLIPKRALGIALKEIRNILKVKLDGLSAIELLYLSRLFGVSFLAAAKRCEREKLLLPGAASSFEKALCQEFGGPEERAAALDLPGRVPVTIDALPRLSDLEIKPEISNYRKRIAKALRVS